MSLKTILDGMLMEAEGDDDHYLKNLRRSLLLRYAKDAIREVNKRAGNDIKSFEVTVPTSLTWPLPQDFVNFVRISVVMFDKETSSYRLQRLDMNRNINMAIGYLQDNDGELLFDNDGNILQADSLNAMAVPYKRYKFCQNVDTYKLSKWGEFNYDRGVIAFSSDLSDREVVIEYISDGLSAELSEEEILVHKNIRKPIEDYIYWLGIRRRVNVPQSEKQAAKRTYNTSLHQAKLDTANLDPFQIAKQVRGGNVLP